MNVLHYLSDCIIKNVLWNVELSTKEKKKMMLKIITKVPYKERLYYDKDNEIYLKMLYKSIKSNKSIY